MGFAIWYHLDYSNIFFTINLQKKLIFSQNLFSAKTYFQPNNFQPNNFSVMTLSTLSPQTLKLNKSLPAFKKPFYPFYLMFHKSHFLNHGTHCSGAFFQFSFAFSGWRMKSSHIRVVMNVHCFVELTHGFGFIFWGGKHSILFNYSPVGKTGCDRRVSSSQKIGFVELRVKNQSRGKVEAAVDFLFDMEKTSGRMPALRFVFFSHDQRWPYQLARIWKEGGVVYHPMRAFSTWQDMRSFFSQIFSAKFFQPIF